MKVSAIQRLVQVFWATEPTHTEDNEGRQRQRKQTTHGETTREDKDKENKQTHIGDKKGRQRKQTKIKLKTEQNIT